MSTNIVIDINQLIYQLIASISIGGLVGAGIFIWITRIEIKQLKEDNKNLKNQIAKDIQSESSLMESKLDGRIKVLETDLKNSKEFLDKLRTDLKEESIYFRNVGNRITQGKIGLD